MSVSETFEFCTIGQVTTPVGWSRRNTRSKMRTNRRYRSQHRTLDTLVQTIEVAIPKRHLESCLRLKNTVPPVGLEPTLKRF